LFFLEKVDKAVATGTALSPAFLFFWTFAHALGMAEDADGMTSLASWTCVLRCAHVA